MEGEWRDIEEECHVRVAVVCKFCGGGGRARTALDLPSCSDARGMGKKRRRRRRRKRRKEVGVMRGTD
ncbi:hypothetical protein E2C01_095020 [Portunus trituberculatus]|uniref:Uncharacterized protein n=1 Tax=Portunus trituberculatus TaxID=210409 RepID=A0A5B7JYF3_PORTR|nr:hypothetical protein [Portunus trituberculatus]